MMREHNFHIVMHLMVMGTAVLMWWPVAGGDAVERPIDPPAQLLYLFLLGHADDGGGGDDHVRGSTALRVVRARAALHGDVARSRTSGSAD